MHVCYQAEFGFLRNWISLRLDTNNKPSWGIWGISRVVKKITGNFLVTYLIFFECRAEGSALVWIRVGTAECRAPPSSTAHRRKNPAGVIIRWSHTLQHKGSAKLSNFLYWCDDTVSIINLFYAIGPCNWPRLFPDFCAGRRQSPINIPVSRTWYSSSLKNSLRFHDYSCSHPCDGEFELENKGTTLEVIVTSADASITLKDLGRKYILEQFHFHWGKVNSRGSEHHYSGRIFSAEVSSQKTIPEWFSGKLRDVTFAASYLCFSMC